MKKNNEYLTKLVLEFKKSKKLTQDQLSEMLDMTPKTFRIRLKEHNWTKLERFFIIEVIAIGSGY